MSSHGWLRLRVSLTVAMLALLSMAIAAGMVRSVALGAMKLQAGRHGTVSCQNLASQVAGRLAETTRDLLFLASLEDVRHCVEEEPASRKLEETAQVLRQFLKSRPDFSQIQLRLAEGPTVLRVPGHDSDDAEGDGSVPLPPGTGGGSSRKLLRIVPLPGTAGQPFFRPSTGREGEDGMEFLRCCVAVRSTDGSRLLLLELDMPMKLLLRDLQSPWLGEHWMLTVREEAGRQLARRASPGDRSGWARFEVSLIPDEEAQRRPWSVELRLPAARLLAAVGNLDRSIWGAITLAAILGLVIALAVAQNLTGLILETHEEAHQPPLD